MELENALFEDLQALSDDAEALGLTDIALVLEFAMDVYLHQTCARTASQTHDANEQIAPRPDMGDPSGQKDVQPVAWLSPAFPLAQIFRVAS
ncbi:MAG: hypothetical protein ACJAZ1_000064 [Yoonia sp.]|jgi:hypothetical protein